MINELAFRLRQRSTLQQNFDANEALFLERELTQLRLKLFEVQFTPTMARTFAPKATDIAPSAETYSYKVYEPIGKAKLIAYKGGDIPRVDVIAKEVLGKVHPIGASYGWTINELREAARLQLALPEVKARTAADVIERGIDTILAFGSLPDETGAYPDVGLLGLINNALVEAIGIMAGKYWVLADGTVNPTPLSPAVILEDLGQLASTVSTFSSNVWNVNTILLPTAHYNYIQQTPFSSLTGETILTVFKRNNPQITQIAPWYKLNAAGAGGLPRAIAYQKDSAILESIVPQEFEVMPPEVRGFEFLNNCHARCGGVKIYQPLACRYMDFAIT